MRALREARSGVFQSRRRAIPGSSPETDDAALWRQIDELFAAWPSLVSILREIDRDA